MTSVSEAIFCLRQKSWKPECALSFNMGWRIKFTNIHQPMLKLKTHSGLEYFDSDMSNISHIAFIPLIKLYSNMTTFSRFANK
jgi:hypothetical protein